MMGPGGLKGPLTLLQHAVGSMMMDIIWGEHRDPSVAMLGVVPGEERSAEGDGSGEVVEAPRESGGMPSSTTGRGCGRRRTFQTAAAGVRPNRHAQS